ncbi:kinase [Ruminococcus gauvreauii]|uniref:kinase n=1 Tax=Ruminococcus gauvreauii TaxID=438033 RepID=UPI0039841BAB
MRLEKIQKKLKDMRLEFRYTEVDGCGSLDFEYRGVGYHVWEFEDNGFGAETNVRNGGQSEDVLGDYEEEIIRILDAWK